MTLNMYHVTQFMKRLRKYNPPGIKFYAVGEYGYYRKRPHYHLLIFGARMETIHLAWRKTTRSELIGHIYYGFVSGASVGYCLKYISERTDIPQFDGDDRKPEKAQMSKGLGREYIENPLIRAWHFADLNNRMYCTTEQGVKLSMPRYYKDKLYSPEQREQVAYYQQLRMREELEKSLQNPEEHLQKIKESEAALRSNLLHKKNTRNHEL